MGDSLIIVTTLDELINFLDVLLQADLCHPCPFRQSQAILALPGWPKASQFHYALICEKSQSALRLDLSASQAV
jgi:hypothetical protein